ncbi:MAG: hypothetical protein HZB56_22685 [Deltaproteobacteria bacterium]|nr:hypothetical protein [Deltaproteobacteria bacterium]
MGRCLGARDLGLSIDWRYRFIGHGERASTTPGVVYVDVGGALAPGVLDHHGLEGGSCAAEVVLQNRELAYNHLLGPWLERHATQGIPEGTRWQATIVTHVSPDWDGVVAAYLVRRLIEEGDFPAGAHEAVAFTRQVDQGRYAIDVGPGQTRWAVHLAYLALQSLKSQGSLPPSQAHLLRGFELIDHWIARAAGPSLLSVPSLTSWAEEPPFADLRDMLEADRRAFERDRAQARLLEKVKLPAADGGEPIEVPAWVAPQPTESLLNKYWVRAAGYPLFVCPYGESEIGGSDHFPRVIVSVDPVFRVAGRAPTLRGLGFALEQAEEAERALRNGGVDDRGGPPRFDDGSCKNADPWYDGRGHEWTIVDAPRNGTALDYASVVRIATEGHFWEVPLVRASVTLVWDLGQPGEHAPGASSALRPFPGMAPTLAPLYADSTEATARHADASAREDDRLLTAERLRFYPIHCSSAPMRVVRIDAQPGATLESLVECCRELEADCAADYRLVKVQPGVHFAPAARVSGLLRAVAGGDLATLDALSSEQETLLFSGRAVLSRLMPSPDAVHPLGPDADEEVLLYVAYLWQTLLAFSRRISDLVPSGRAGLDGIRVHQVRTDFLRFQTRYYQLEVSRLDRGRMLFGALTQALGMFALYGEVQSELDRLAELEEGFAVERRTRADEVIQATLYFLSVAGIFQTILAFLTWQERGPQMWWWVTPILVGAVGLYSWVRWKARAR